MYSQWRYKRKTLQKQYINIVQHWVCVGSKCHLDGCKVEKFTWLVVSRCRAGRQDASPYGCLSPPDASRPSHWLSQALLSLYKVKSCISCIPWLKCWKTSVCVYLCVTIITWLESWKDRVDAFLIYSTNIVADYLASLLHVDWSFKEVMKSWCVLLLGLYLARGACVSLIEGSLWHGCSGLPHRGASSGSRWGEIRQG